MIQQTDSCRESRCTDLESMNISLFDVRRRRGRKRMAILHFVLFLSASLTFAETPRADNKEPIELEAEFLTEEGPKRMELRIAVDGVSASSLWDEGMVSLIRHCDRDENGTLDAREAARLPSTFGLRQLTWGLFRPTGPPPEWNALDRDHDSKVTNLELSNYYREAGAGPVLVAVASTPSHRLLDEALRKAIDSDGDGIMDADEAANAEASLRRLDLNDDEQVSAEELIPGIAYPGGQGTRLLTAGMVSAKVGGADVPPLKIRPTRNLDESQAKNHSSHGGDLVLISCEIQLGSPPVGSTSPPDRPVYSILKPGGWLSANAGQLRFHLRADEGTLREALKVHLEQLRGQFAEVSPSSKAVPLALILPLADLNDDQLLSREELEAVSTLLEHLARGRILITIRDHGRGLFEVIDSDLNGILSPRELRTARERLNAAGCLTKGVIDFARLPRTLTACVSIGHPRQTIQPRSVIGPTWFVAMDRNRDGDISAREWVGDPLLFSRFDRDQDGLMNSEEALAPPK